MTMMRKLPLALAMLLPAVNPALSATCEQELGLHGFKAAAQVACHFGQRENEAMDSARACARQQDASLNLMQLHTGDAVFQATTRKMGRKAACEDVFNRFAGIFYRLH